MTATLEGVTEKRGTGRVEPERSSKGTAPPASAERGGRPTPESILAAPPSIEPPGKGPGGARPGAGRPRKDGAPPAAVPGAPAAPGEPEEPPAPPPPPWTEKETAPLVGLAFTQAGKFRKCPEAWAIDEPTKLYLASRIVAVANKYGLMSRFREEILLGIGVTITVYGCMLAEEAIKARKAEEKKA